MDRLIAGLVLVTVVGFLVVTFRVAGRAAGTAFLLWTQYRGRFPMTLLLDESEEAVEDGGPVLGVLVVIVGGVTYGVGRFFALPSVAGVGKFLALAPLVLAVLWFVWRLAFNTNAFMNEDTGLKILRTNAPRIRLLTERLAAGAPDPLLQAYRHAWRSKLLVRLLVLKDSKVGFSDASLEEYAQLDRELNLAETIKTDLEAIGDPAESYLKNAVTQVRAEVERSTRKLSRQVAKAARPRSPTEKFLGSRLVGLAAFALTVFFTVRLLRTAPFPPDRVKSAFIELAVLYLLALIIAAVNARCRRNNDWFGALVCFWLPPVAVIWSIVLILSGPSQPKSTPDEPAGSSEPEANGGG